jgi:multisubunit Na+/H+ antiporter MnhB subunit
MGENEKSRKGVVIVSAAVGLAVLAALVAFLLTTESSMTQRQRAATYEATAAEHLRNVSAAQQIYLDAYGSTQPSTNS